MNDTLKADKISETHFYYALNERCQDYRFTNNHRMWPHNA